MAQIKLLFFLTIIMSFYSCRVGNDDPLISLYSRNRRICGNWELTNATYSITQKNSVRLTQHSYNYAKPTLTIDNDSSIFYSLNLTIEKDGKASAKIHCGTKYYQITGYWWWLNNSRNKSAIEFSFSPIKDIGDFNRFKITNLHREYMVWQISGEKSYTSEGVFFSTSFNGEYKFKRKE